MAQITINFQANTTGDHYVGYREDHIDPPNTYTVITVSVAAPGAQQAIIPIPGSLYCGELHYSGYVIAACEVQDDTNPADGIPDEASTWSETLAQQTDPCTHTIITCDNVPIQSLAVDTKGYGYTLAQTVNIDAPTAPGGVQATATATTGDGIVTSVVQTQAGSNYVDGSYTGVPAVGLLQTAKDGAGLTVDVTISGGAITSLALNAGGSGYTVDDNNNSFTLDEDHTPYLGADGEALTGTLGAVVGTGYADATGVGTTGGSGTGLTVDITIDGGITTLPANPTAGGTGYGGLTTGTLIGGNSDATISFTETGGVIDNGSISLTLAGSGYANGEVCTVSGGNADATVTVTTVNGNIVSAVINNGGKNYVATDVVTITGGSGDETYTVDTIRILHEMAFTVACTGSFDDEIHEVTLTDPGSGYQTPPNITLSPGSESAPAGNWTYTLVMEDCPSLDISAYVCASVNTISGDTSYVLPLADSLDLCTDDTTTGAISAQFDVADQARGCKCLGCELLTVDTTGATVGTGTISYQKCWDAAPGEELETQNITFGQGALIGVCVIPETVTVDQGTLDAAPVLNYAACP